MLRYNTGSAVTAYIFLSSISSASRHGNSTLLHSSIFHTLLSQQDYERSDPPREYETTVVKLGIYINMFHGINEKTQEFSISFYLRQFWSDPRLRFDHIRSAPSKINLGQDSWNKLWIPDIFFPNLKNGEYVDITVSNRLMQLHVTGDIFYVAAMKAIFTCPMKFHNYPFDTQLCTIRLQSFSHLADVVKLEWSDASVGISPEVELFSHTISELSEIDCSKNFSFGVFPYLCANFTFQRRYGHLITQMYFPSILMIILSWIPFWIESSIDILVGLMIVLALLMQTSTSDLPQISYITAVGIWFLVCVIYVFIALVLYTIGQMLKEHQDNRVRKFRLWCRILLPVSFCFFTMSYFLVYATIIV